MTAPVDHPLDLAMQAFLTYASWALTLLFLVVAIRMGQKDRTPFYVYVLLASIIGAFAEPIYDVGLMLWFYTPGIWTHFSAFGIPQPNWTHSGYAVLYGSAAIFVCWQINQNRLSRKGLYAWAGVAFLMSCTFEIMAINGGTYEYWGPHVFRILQYPLVIGVLEATQVICFSVAAAELRRRASSRLGLLGVFAIFPATFYGANFGAGAPVIVAMHLDPVPPQGLIYAAAVLSILAAATLVRIAAGFLPIEAGSHADRPAPDQGHLVPARG